MEGDPGSTGVTPFKNAAAPVLEGSGRARSGSWCTQSCGLGSRGAFRAWAQMPLAVTRLQGSGMSVWTYLSLLRRYLLPLGLDEKLHGA